MAAELIVVNRQRRYAVDRPWVEATGLNLLQALLDNLKKSPPSHLRPGDLVELESRGVFSLALISNARIRQLNLQWMGKDRPTDVLSFPMELDPPPPGMPWEAGEILISVEKASEQAHAYGHSLERELAFLLVHGLLHVLGFDHQNPKDEKEMFGRQREILNSCGMAR